MKALKIIGLIILLILAVVVVVPYFLPDNVSVSAEAVIKAKPQVIYRQVNNLSKWKAWSPFETDTTMVVSFSGPEQGVGATRSWDGEKVGTGKMTIIESDPYKFISNKLEFGPDGGGGVGTWNFTPEKKGTKVVWNVQMLDMGYFERWFGLFANATLKPMLKDGLNKLSEVAQATPEPINVRIAIMDPKPTMVIDDSATMEGMSEMFEKDYSDLMAYVNKKQIPITGKQFAVYHNWNPKGYTRISCGVPVNKEYKGSGRISYFELPGGEAVFAKHVGGYNTGTTHNAINNYIKDFNLKTRDFIWETYLYNPMKDTDSTQWVTLIYYPLVKSD